jgi:hypothetical protein
MNREGAKDAKGNLKRKDKAFALKFKKLCVLRAFAVQSFHSAIRIPKSAIL